MKKETKKKSKKVINIIMSILFTFLILIFLLEVFITIREGFITKGFKEDNKKILGTYNIIEPSDEFPETLNITNKNSAPYCMGYEKDIQYYSYAENGKMYVIYYLNDNEYLFELKDGNLFSPKILKENFDCVTFSIHSEQAAVTDIAYQKKK